MRFYRDGQNIDGNTMGGVITNLHLPRDWPIFEQQHPPVEGDVEESRGQNRRVHIAIGCHPKQAALLTAPLLRRLEELVRRPGAVAVGECGLDYSARWCVRYPDFVLPSATQEFRWQEGAGPCISSSDPIGTSLQPASSSPRQGSGQVLGGVPSWRRLLPDSGWVQCAKEFSHS